MLRFVALLVSIPVIGEVVARTGLPVWAALPILGVMAAGHALLCRREQAAGRAAMARAPTHSGQRIARFDAEGFAVSGSDWRMSAVWTADMRAVAYPEGVAVMVTPMTFLPLPASALAPETSQAVAGRINELAVAGRTGSHPSSSG